MAAKLQVREEWRRRSQRYRYTTTKACKCVVRWLVGEFKKLAVCPMQSVLYYDRTPSSFDVLRWLCVCVTLSPPIEGRAKRRPFFRSLKAPQWRESHFSREIFARWKCPVRSPGGVPSSSAFWGVGVGERLLLDAVTPRVGGFNPVPGLPIPLSSGLEPHSTD